MVSQHEPTKRPFGECSVSHLTQFPLCFEALAEGQPGVWEYFVMSQSLHPPGCQYVSQEFVNTCRSFLALRPLRERLPLRRHRTTPVSLASQRLFRQKYQLHYIPMYSWAMLQHHHQILPHISCMHVIHNSPYCELCWVVINGGTRCESHRRRMDSFAWDEFSVPESLWARCSEP